MRADVVIRTPDQRLRVFVSSTVGEHGELAEERRAVARAVSALRLTPVLFELGARPHPPQDLYRAYLALAGDGQVERAGQARQAAVLQSLDRAGGLAQGGGHLADGQAGGQLQQQHLPLVGGELVQRGHHPVALQAPHQSPGSGTASARAASSSTSSRRSVRPRDPKAEVVQVVGGDPEQPAAQPGDLAAEPGQGLHRGGEDHAGEVLGGTPVADPRR
jgi:Domain of unknown function (DUF4062)